MPGVAGDILRLPGMGDHLDDAGAVVMCDYFRSLCTAVVLAGIVVWHVFIELPLENDDE